MGAAKGLSVDIKDLCEKTMLKIVEKSERVNEGNRVLSEKALKAITDCTSVMAKLADSVSRLDKTIREFDKKEERREEARQSLELTREEEWRKALGRLREEERKWDDRRREFERQDRQDRREIGKIGETGRTVKTRRRIRNGRKDRIGETGRREMTEERRRSRGQKTRRRTEMRTQPGRRQWC